MGKKSVEKLFESLYKLIDLRTIFRETSPTHELSDEKKEKMKRLIEEVKENLDDIKGEMAS